MLLAALEDVAKVLCTPRPDVADKIANETLKLPPGILTAAVDEQAAAHDRQPAWEPATRKSITDMMERAVKAGFYKEMPDEKIIYALIDALDEHRGRRHGSSSFRARRSSRCWSSSFSGRCCRISRRRSGFRRSPSRAL